jgi:peptidoglycan-associated lipoprotein
MKEVKPVIRLSTIAMAVTLGACSWPVMRGTYDSEIADLHSTDTTLARDIEELRAELASMKKDVHARLIRYDGTVAEMRNKVKLDTTAHFGYDDATLRQEDKALLNEFVEATSEYQPDILVTVEGFADPAGDANYNIDLAERRAEAVRSYLIAQGFPGDKLRTASYGEDPQRQVQPGAWGAQGELNRRATLVVEYVAEAQSTRAASR